MQVNTIETNKIIDGKFHAANLLQKVKLDIQNLIHNDKVTPGLAVVIVGQHPASLMYVNLKTKKAAEIGISSTIHHLDQNVEQQKLLKVIHDLNIDPAVHGILVQMPLPAHININYVLDAIDPQKDVDGFTSVNVGKLHLWRECLEPCTPQGILYLLKQHLHNLNGKLAVVIGRSMIVGRPMSAMLLRENCTVTVVHSQSNSSHIFDMASKADILIVAVGKAQMIKGDFIKEGACVIDVGINKTTDGKIYGDVDFVSAHETCSYITPVPGGVGPMTVACLLANTVKATYSQLGLCYINSL